MILCICPNPSIDKFIWLDEFRFGKVNRIQKQKSYPGGKGVHVALGIVELEEPCALLAFWGGDTGKFIRDYCESKGIVCYGPTTEKPNRTCFTFRSDGVLDGTEILEPGPLIDEEKGSLFWKEYIRLLDDVSTVCISGSWPPTKNETDYAAFIVAAKQKGIKTFIDCSGETLLNALTANPYCIHINSYEGLEVFYNSQPEKITEAALKSCDQVAITYGEGGLYLARKKNLFVHANCKLDHLISTVGCGDSLMAGLIVAEKRNLGFNETAKLSVACAASNCIREELGMFNKADVENLIGKVALMTLDYSINF